MSLTKPITWTEVEKVTDIAQRVLLYGPPGTGKTRFALTHGLRGREAYSLTLCPEASSAEIRGHYVVTPDGTIWRDGLGIMAWRIGGRLVLNEINEASGDILTILYAICDDLEVATITLPTGETLRPKKSFQIIATMNGYPEDLPDALRDRFSVAIEILEPHPDAIEALPRFLRDVAKNTIIKGASSKERNVSVRQWFELAAMLDKDVDVKLACNLLFQERGAEIANALSLSRI